MPNFVGLTVWGHLAVVVWVVGKIALSFFLSRVRRGKASSLFLHELVVYVLAGAAIVTTVQNTELTGAPVPRSLIPSNQSGRSDSPLIAEAVAQSMGEWIYCGDYDPSKRQWTFTNLNIQGRAPTELKDRKFSAEKSVEVFDRAPTFSIISLKWNFGQKISALSPGQQIT